MSSSGTYGGWNPFPMRFGGGKRRLQHITEALNASRGNAYDTSDWSSSPSVENRALARAADAEWAINSRAQAEFDPNKTQDMLPRWETIFAITPPQNATPSSRRAALAFKFAALGKKPTTQQVTDDLTAIGGGCFVELEHTIDADSQTLYPGSSNTNPYDASGTTTAGVSFVDWASAVLHVTVQVQQPTGMSFTVFNDYVNAMMNYLDGALPAWCTFSWYVLAHSNALGFYLDDPKNLGWEALDG